jgi:diacylglycerol kinase family enzyme
MQLVRMSLLALFGRLRDADEFEVFSTSEAIVETRGGAVKVSLDGEVAVMKAPLHYRIRPASLRVLVP